MCTTILDSHLKAADCLYLGLDHKHRGSHPCCSFPMATMTNSLVLRLSVLSAGGEDGGGGEVGGGVGDGGCDGCGVVIRRGSAEKRIKKHKNKVR